MWLAPSSGSAVGIAAGEPQEAGHRRCVCRYIDRVSHQSHAPEHLGVRADDGERRLSDIVAGVRVHADCLGEVPRVTQRVPDRERQDVVDRRFSEPVVADSADRFGMDERFEEAVARGVPQPGRVPPNRVSPEVRSPPSSPWPRLRSSRRRRGRRRRVRTSLHMASRHPMRRAVRVESRRRSRTAPWCSCGGSESRRPPLGSSALREGTTPSDGRGRVGRDVEA